MIQAEEAVRPSDATVGSAPSGRGRRRAWIGGLILIVALAATLRVIPLTSGIPYSTYIDENHVVGSAEHMVAHHTWDPGFYQYPSLLMNLTAAGEEVYAHSTGVRPVTEAKVAERVRYSDVVAPASLLTIGRLWVALSSIGTVIVTALLARRLAGRAAGLAAGLLVAVLPALVSRSAIVIVDTPATFFVMAALLLAVLAADRYNPVDGGAPAARRWIHPDGVAVIWVLGAGAAVGMALTSKYPSGAFLLGVLIIVAGGVGMSVRARVISAVSAAVAAGVAAAITMPALVVKTDAVRQAISVQSATYASKSGPSYLSQGIRPSEVGWIVLGAGLVGLVLLVIEPRSRLVAVGWLVSVVPLTVFLVGQNYQPFRNMLPLLPFVVIGAATFIVTVATWLSARLRGGRRLRWGLTGALVVGLAALLLVQGTLPAVRHQTGIVDTRQEAVDWLAAHTTPGMTVVVARELAILPSELNRIPAKVVVADQTGPHALHRATTFGYVVTGTMPAGAEDWVQGGKVAAKWGYRPVPRTANLWRTNNETVQIVLGY